MDAYISRLNELEEKLKNGEELVELEKLEIINRRRKMLEDNYTTLYSSDFTFMKSYTLVLRFLGMLGGKKTKYLPEAMKYYGATLEDLRCNYKELLTGANVVSEYRNDTNLVIFVDQVAELRKYEDTLNKFEDSLNSGINKGLKSFAVPIGMEEMLSLDESKEKIKNLSKKYIK